MTTPRFQPRNGTPYAQADAEIVCPELVRLYRERGGLTTSDVLDAARDSTSPLHRYFDWDDATAAEKFRKHQAGKLLRSFEVVWQQNRREHRVGLMQYVVVELAEAPAAPATTTATSSTAAAHRSRSTAPSPRESRAYVVVTDVMDSQDYQQQLLERARQDLERWRNRYAQIENIVDFSTNFGRAFRSICALVDSSED